MERLVVLEEAVSSYIRKTPKDAGRGLDCMEWITLKEVCCVLEYCRVATVAIQGGSEGLLSRSIFICHELCSILRLPELEVFDFKNMRNGCGENTEPRTLKSVIDMQESVQTAVEVGVEQLIARGVTYANHAVEIIALYLDPRTKSLDMSTCGNGDEDSSGRRLLCRAREAILAVGSAMDLKRETESIAPSDHDTPESGGLGSGPVEPGPKRPRNMYDIRQQQRRTAALQSTRQAGHPALTFSARLGLEMVAYNDMPPFTTEHVDVIGFWRQAANAKVDEQGNIFEAPKLPLLSMLARVYLSIDSTSYQSERDLSALAGTLGQLRCSMKVDKVEKLMYLRLNSDLIPEVEAVKAGLDRLQAVKEKGRALAAAAQKDGVGEVVTIGAPAQGGGANEVLTVE